MAIFKVVSPYGKYKDLQTYHDTISYIFNPDKTPHRFYVSRGVSSPENAAYEMKTLTRVLRKKGTLIRHMVLSFDPKERISPDIAYQIAWELADFYAYDYQIVAAVHEDKAHTHIHFVMNTVSFIDGKKYKGQKKDYYDFKLYASETLRRYGLCFRYE